MGMDLLPVLEYGGNLGWLPKFLGFSQEVDAYSWPMLKEILLLYLKMEEAAS